MGAKNSCRGDLQSPFGSLAICVRPMALRPDLSVGLPFRGNLDAAYRGMELKSYCIERLVFRFRDVNLDAFGRGVALGRSEDQTSTD